MVFRKRILPLAVVLALGALCAFASSPQTSTKAASSAAPKDKAQPKPKVHVLHGSVVTVSADVLTVRSGGKDTVFKLDSSTQKPASMDPGSQIAVTYSDEGKQHVASAVELSPAKGAGSSPSSHKK